jgi:SAM-dependent methyltransferase
LRGLTEENKCPVNGSPVQYFQFGRNWRSFLPTLNALKITEAERSLKDLLGREHLQGKTFLDIGSGSGLFSLAAMRLGAQQVHSFDVDPVSVACSGELKNRYFPHAKNWSMEQGSILDPQFLKTLGEWDIVYAWGVLHHTGNMSQAFENVVPLVADSGQFVVAVYNNQRWISRYWTGIKRMYNKHMVFRGLIILFHFPYLFGGRWGIRFLTGRLSLERGMSLWRDMLDWLGGYPFETARPEQVFDFFIVRGFKLTALKTVGGRQGCNEFVFRKSLSRIEKRA